MSENNEAAEHTNLLDKLRAENKALQEDKADLSGAIEELTEHKKGLMKSYKKLILQYKALKESKNAILEACQELIQVNNYPLTESFHRTVGEALKEKETK